MLLSITKQVEQKINRMQSGKIFFISDFASFSNDTAVRQALIRLANSKEIVNISQGIYYKPLIDKKLGVVYPSVTQLAQAIARRDKARIIATGSFAMYKLGLTTQIPMNIVYLTDGSARKIQVKRMKITFKKTSPKNLAVQHEFTGLLIQALKEIGEKNITAKEKTHIKKIIIQNGEFKKIKENIVFAPVWIQKIIIQIINSIKK